MPEGDANIPLPAPRRRHSPEDHMKMSRRFVAHARSELAKGHRLQSSEKVWGAAAHALKAIAIQRGWNHRSHDLMYVIATQLQAERGRPDLAARFGYTESHHRNFYNNDRFSSEINIAIDNVEELVEELDAVLREGAWPYTVEKPEDQDRLEELTGRRYSIGAKSANGFTVPQRSWKYPARGQRDRGNGGGAALEVRPKPGGSSPSSGQANRPPGSVPEVQWRSGQNAPPGKERDAGVSRNPRRRNPRNHRGNRGGESREVNIKLT